MAGYDENVLKRLHETELEILDAIAALCAEEHINWFLIGGSILGARRHGGFIPWDDDIDTGMLREDYDRFLEVAPRKLPPEFELISPMETPNYAPMFAKVCKKGTRFQSREAVDAGADIGIFVDIFPRDLIADDSATRKRQLKLARRYTRMSYLYHSDHITRTPPGIYGALARKSFPLVHRLLRTFGNEDSIRRRFLRGTALPAGVPAANTASFTSPSMAPLPVEMFAYPEWVEFEGRMVPIPAESDLYLEVAYGKTWMQVPPPEKRKSHAAIILDFGDGVNVAQG